MSKTYTKFMVEGTWELPDTPAQKRQLKKLMSKPLPVGSGKESQYKNSAESKLYSLIGDDELFDDIYELRQKKGEKADARPIVKKYMKKFGIKEEVEIREGKEVKYKVGDKVITKMGPHKGEVHKVIHVHSDGRYNVAPLSRKVKYRHGAASAKGSDLELYKEEVEMNIDEAKTGAKMFVVVATPISVGGFSQDGKPLVAEKEEKIALFSTKRKASAWIKKQKLRKPGPNGEYKRGLLYGMEYVTIEEYVHPEAPPFMEEVEEIDELKKTTMARYIKKAAGTSTAAAYQRGHAKGGQVATYGSSGPDVPGEWSAKEKRDYRRKMKNRTKGIARAADKLAKEEVENNEDWTPGVDGPRKRTSKQVARRDRMGKIAAKETRKEKDDRKAERFKDQAWYRKLYKNSTRKPVKKEEVEIREGTPAVPTTKSKWNNLQKIMTKKIPVGDEGAKDSAEMLIHRYLDDDNLSGTLRSLRKGKGPKADARPAILQWLKRNGFDIKKRDGYKDSDWTKNEEVGFNESEAPSSTVGGVGGGMVGEPPGPTKKKKKREIFAGDCVFEVSSDTFMKCKGEKPKYARYIKHIGDDEDGQVVREYGLRNPSKGIIIKDSTYGAMMYLRRRKS